MENDVYVYVCEYIYVYHTHTHIDEHISILIMFMILIYIACVVNPHNNTIQILIFRFDFSKTWVTKGSHI